ncbi:NADP-dependent 3-hydroxy acid dehydrogenase YdfG [Sporobacter termitidis DSM 10068]|uniref:NADP-dependent 3-hydroxy acid dehydrogenase YdfG n=1 Tax=Sporobacter termitidis DSM 10068 TaxID=1123282 RepID=A0A1M5ZGM8_9FIRM|nr:SDR family NAD(P)-dependent oxidoreductase [Sporobacter termitidis]SHI23334.1 NADP-dependent 3-hydroxy acid dehydrogenase YdfG [Sporobacter termitidis DSM 10068]
MSNHNQKAVLVTGSSSGIGRACGMYLAERGYLVFAGVRKGEDADKLAGLGLKNLVPVCPLDMTKPEDITGAGRTIEEELSKRGIPGLYAVLNNAGGGFIAPLELMDIDKWRRETETRLVGPVALLQATLPLLRKGGGRVLWIQTPGLMPIAFDASIHACDFASNCLSRTLGQELKPWGIPSIQIRCGAISTPSVERSYRELAASMAQWSSAGLELYNEALRKTEKSFRAMDAGRSDPEMIARLVFRALGDRKPKRRYHAGAMSGVSAVMECLPHPLVDRIMEKR